MQDNEEKDIHMQLKQAAVFLAEYAATLMAVGAQTSRIVINTQRIAVAWGFNASLLIFTKTLSITLTDPHSRHTFTYVGKTPACPSTSTPTCACHNCHGAYTTSRSPWPK